MARNDEPSYAELVYEVVQAAGRPLTFQEIVDAVAQRRTAPSKNPKATIRGALTNARQIMNDGEGHYGYLPRMISGSLLRLPLTEKKPANHPLTYTEEILHGLWPSFFEGEKRQDRSPIRAQLPNGSVVTLLLDFLGTGAWGCAMPETLHQYLIDQHAQAGDALLIRIVDGERRTFELQFEAHRRRDGATVATRNGELADASEHFLRERRSSDMPSWDLVIALLARGFYRSDVAPDSLAEVLAADARFTPAGYRSWALTESVTPDVAAEIKRRQHMEQSLLGLGGGQGDQDMLPPIPFPLGGGGPLESIFADIRRLMGGQPFESADDAQAFLEQILAPGAAIGRLGVGGLESVPAETPLDRAQDLMFEAWETSAPKKRERLARRALKISPDCADAYVLLGKEVATTAEEAADFYGQGVAAGERVLGPELFVDGVGGFWGIVETRPYMRARLGLAQALWAMDRQSEAISHLHEMLRLNPGDNQGIRYLLLSWLLIVGDDTQAEALLANYDDDGSASWQYGAALVGFRRRGDTSATRRRRAAALRDNPHVPHYLLGQKRLPKHLPELIGFGDEAEAIMCASEQIGAWGATPGALDWLSAVVK